MKTVIHAISALQSWNSVFDHLYWNEKDGWFYSTPGNSDAAHLVCTKGQFELEQHLAHPFAQYIDGKAYVASTATDKVDMIKKMTSLEQVNKALALPDLPATALKALKVKHRELTNKLNPLIPDDFFFNPCGSERPIVSTVGQLKQQLDRLPDSLPIGVEHDSDPLTMVVTLYPAQLFLRRART